MEFSDLAVAKLLQTFPELGPYILTFKDVTEELNKEEEGLRVGIFILKVGDQAFYVPIISKNEVIQPIDSAFDPQDQSFLPITKSYIERIQASNSAMGSSTKIPSTVNKNPSVYELVVPPRTGKFAYASNSQLVEFLAMSPGHVKSAFAEKIASDRELADGINKLFDLGDVIEALRVKTASVQDVLHDTGMEVLTGGDGLSNTEIQDILSKGYALRGVQKETRIAVPAWDFARAGTLRKLSNSDQGLDYEIVFKNGETRSGTYLKTSSVVPQTAALLNKRDANEGFILYSNGDYSTSSAIAVGEGKDGKNVFSTLFQYSAPGTFADVNNGEDILILSPDLEFVSALTVYGIERNSNGISIKGHPLVHGTGIVNIHAFHNSPRINAISRNEFFMPINTLVVKLHKNLDFDLESNENAAQAKLELTTLMTLGGMSTIGFDGIDYSYNGRAVGGAPGILEVLVVKEGIAPSQAENFVKQATENKICKFYMSKKADFEPAEIPQFGEEPAEQAKSFGVDESFVPTLKDSFNANDPQTTQAAILSELLQAPEMNTYIEQYLPEIKEGMDKLGRVLFLMRLNTSSMFTGDNAQEVFALIGSIRNVYRQLGDNILKLERIQSLNIADDQAVQR